MKAYDLDKNSKQNNSFVRFPELRKSSPGAGGATTRPSYMGEKVTPREFAHLKAGVPLKPTAPADEMFDRTDTLHGELGIDEAKVKRSGSL